jgi:hypothetical protein
MSKAVSMSYIPPQKRATRAARAPVKKPFETEFPELVKAVTPTPSSKLNFKNIFKNVERKKRREKPIPKGWIKMTKHGVFDSLTDAERDTAEEWKVYHQMQRNVDRLVERWDKHTAMRLERDGSLSDYSVDPVSDDESYDISSEEWDTSEEENEIQDPNDSKWFTS